MKAIQRKESYQKQFIRKIIKVNDWAPANVNSLWKIKPNLLLVKGTEKKFDKHLDTNKYSGMV